MLPSRSRLSRTPICHSSVASRTADNRTYDISPWPEKHAALDNAPLYLLNRAKQLVVREKASDLLPPLILTKLLTNSIVGTFVRLARFCCISLRKLVLRSGPI